jgi:hypothetical protein
VLQGIVPIHPVIISASEVRPRDQLGYSIPVQTTSKPSGLHKGFCEARPHVDKLG